MKIGTIGELLVQLRLLEFGVQAAPPIKDSGNDLIALRGRVTKLVQVKTSVNKNPRPQNLPDNYDYVFCVNLHANDDMLELDKSEITVIDSSGNDRGTLNGGAIDDLWS